MRNDSLLVERILYVVVIAVRHLVFNTMICWNNKIHLKIKVILAWFERQIYCLIQQISYLNVHINSYKIC